MSKQRHRRRSQGGTTPETRPQTGSGVAHFSVSEVAQFSMSLDKDIDVRLQLRPETLVMAQFSPALLSVLRFSGFSPEPLSPEFLV